MLVKTIGLVDVLRRELAPLPRLIRVAFVFGSIAAGNDRTRSDVDLLIVGDVGLMELAPILSNAESTLLRSVNPVLYSQNEFERRIRSKDHFVSSVLAKPKIMVLGALDDIVGTTGKGRNRRGRKDKPGRDTGTSENGREGSE